MSLSDLKKKCRLAIEDIAKPSSGYGKLFVHPDGRVLFSTWDGDEENYAKQIKVRLEKVAGKGNVSIEAEHVPNLEDGWEEVKLKYTKSFVLNQLHRIATDLERNSIHEAQCLHDVFLRVAGVEHLLEHQDVIHAEMTLEDALNNYDSSMYRVDAKGNWNPEEWITIEEFAESLPGDALSAPAAIDANHIAFELPEVGFQVVNLVPRSEWADEEVEASGQYFTKEQLSEYVNKGDKSSQSSQFRQDLEKIINSCSKENGSDTPDFVLAEYLDDCLKAFDKAISQRESLRNAAVNIAPRLVKIASIADSKQKHRLADSIENMLSKAIS